MVGRSRYLPEKFRNIVYNVIQRNAFAAHPEMILLSMINDDDIFVRKKGLDLIIKSRNGEVNQQIENTSNINTRLGARNRGRTKNKKTEDQLFRTFKTPKLNFNASEYYNMINWEDSNIKAACSPPVLAHATIEEISNFIKERKHPVINEILSFPCHTQSVERVVKCVTEASAAVCGEENRDGFIRTKLQSSQKIPKFNTKSDYKITKFD